MTSDDSSARLHAHLSEQIEILNFLSYQYDTGNEVLSKPIAACLRTLLHDTSSSHSVLGQMDMKKTLSFFSTPQLDKNLPQFRMATPIMNGKVYSSKLHPDLPPELDLIWKPKYDYFKSQEYGLERHVARVRWARAHFEDWWQDPVFPADEHGILSRKQLVVATIANEEGGSHVAPNASRRAEAVVNPKFKITIKAQGVSKEADRPPHYAAIRQVAFELQMTLKDKLPDHPAMKSLTPPPDPQTYARHGELADRPPLAHIRFVLHQLTARGLRDDFDKRQAELLRREIFWHAHPKG